MKQDIIFECGFFGRGLNRMGCMYYCPVHSELENPELIFTTLYIAKILTYRKIPLSVAQEMQYKLRNTEVLKEIVASGRNSENKESARVAPCIEIIDYKSSWKAAISSSMMVKEKPVFRLGYMGFGFFFTNKRRLGYCAEQSIYGLLDTMQRLHKEDELFLEKLYQAVASVASLPFGEELNRKNYYEAALKINGLVI